MLYMLIRTFGSSVYMLLQLNLVSSQTDEIQVMFQYLSTPEHFVITFEYTLTLVLVGRLVCVDVRTAEVYFQDEWQL